MIDYCTMIDLKGALDILDTGKWVSLSFVKYNLVNTKDNGAICRIERCRLLRKELAEHNMPAIKGYTKSAKPKASRNPNHYDNATRNVQLYNGQIRKFHIRLLFEINGQKLL